MDIFDLDTWDAMDEMSDWRDASARFCTVCGHELNGFESSVGALCDDCRTYRDFLGVQEDRRGRFWPPGRIVQAWGRLFALWRQTSKDPNELPF